MRHPSKNPGLSIALALCGSLLAVACTRSDSIGSGGNKDGGGNADCSQPPPGPTQPTNCGCGCAYYTCADGTWQKGMVLICLPDARRSACGDGVMDVGEECDDGNTAGGDGCSPFCYVEYGWSCPTPGQSCISLLACGNGLLSPGEVCDDGNTVGGDGCSEDCQQVEPGWRCRVPGKPCTEACAVDAGGCADGDVTAVCGNGIVEPGEECDFGGDASKPPHNGDGSYGGCASDCTWGAYCGDGVVNGPEACDDGPANGGLSGRPGCTFLCTKAAYCGDGIVDDGEECDLGAQNSDICGALCTRDCRIWPGIMCRRGRRRAGSRGCRTPPESRPVARDPRGGTRAYGVSVSERLAQRRSVCLRFFAGGRIGHVVHVCDRPTLFRLKRRWRRWLLGRPECLRRSRVA